MRDIKNLEFARTTWANIQLARLCPHNDINKLGEIMETPDFALQMENIIKIICIFNEAFERKAHYENPEHEINPVTEEDLMNLDENELTELLNKAFEVFGLDAQTEIETVEKKKKGKNAESPFD